MSMSTVLKAIMNIESISVNSKIILCTPAVIGERKEYTNSQDGDLNRYSNVIRKLANEFSLPLVDLRKLFVDYDGVNNLENKDRR